MLPLPSIPTEIIRKGFQPTRGFLLTLDVAIAPEDGPLRSMVGSPISPLAAAKAAEFAVDFTPVFQVFADLFGYDLAQLRAGDGDCGVAGHDWNLFGRKDRVPLVIRWRRPEGGEAIIAIGEMQEGGADLYVAGLANQAMAPFLQQVLVALGELPTVNETAVVDVPTGNVLQKMITPYTMVELFSSAVALIGAKDELSAQARAELERLRFSCLISGRAGHRVTGNVSPQRFRELQASEEPGARQVAVMPEGRFALAFGPAEPIPETVIATIYANSVADAEAVMGRVLAKTFERQAERVQNYLQMEGLDLDPGSVEEAERSAALTNAMATFEKMAVDFCHQFRVTFSEDFRGTPAKTLVGTRSLPALRGGDVRPSPDLLWQAMFKPFQQTVESLILGGKRRQLNGRVIASPDQDLRRDHAALHSRFATLTNPYPSLVRGLPVRVTQSALVWREDDTEALACDFFFDHANRELHFAALYREKVEERK
jgi:hypothetical protein